MSLAEIDGGDPLVRHDLLDGALGEHLTQMQHGDFLRDLPHEGHVVFDCEHGHALGIEPLYHLAGQIRLLRRHPRGRLVEQQEARLQADGHADFEPLLLSVAEIAGELRLFAREPEKSEQTVDLVRERRSAVQPLHRDLQVLAHRQALEHAGHLELDRKPAANPCEGFQRRDVFAGKKDITAAGMMSAEDQPEQRALASTVRPDQAMNLAGFQRKIDRIGDVEAAEMLVQPS